MRRFRGTLTGLVALMLVLGVGVWLDRSLDRPAVAPEALFRFDKESLVAFTIARPDTTIAVRRVDGVWTVQDRTWRPSRSMIRRVAHQLHDLDARATVVDHPEDPSVYGLGPEAIEVSLELDNGRTVAFRVGDPNPTSVSYYMQRLPDDRVYVVKKAAMDFYRLDPEAFREDRVALFDAPDAVRVQATVDGRRIDVERTGPHTWHMTEPVDQEASRDEVRMILGRVSGMRAVRFVEDGPADPGRYGLGVDAPRVVVTLASGERIAVRVGHPVEASDPPQRYVLHEADDAVYAVKDGLLDSFAATADQLRNRDVIGRNGWEVRQLRVVDADGSEVVLTKSADEWRWADGSVVAGSTPKRVASRAAGLRAIAFHDRGVPGGFGPTFAVVELRFEDGAEVGIELGRRWEVDLPKGPTDERPRTEERQYAREVDQPVTYEVGAELADVIADLWREHRRKNSTDADKRLDGAGQGQPNQPRRHR